MRRSQEDFEAEIRSHLELERAQLQTEGISATDAERQARKKFGNVGLVQELFYTARHLRLLDDLRRELKYSVRLLARTPGFTAVAIILLAVGIGATTTLFTAINGVLRRPLPYSQPGQLIALGLVNPQQPDVRVGTSAPDFLDWRRSAGAFSELAAYRPWGFVLNGSIEPERVSGVKATANLFRLLGVAPLVGRTFTGEEDQLGSAPVVVLSEKLWLRRFGGDSSVIGTGIDINGSRHTVVGVVRSGLGPPSAELWTPLVFAPYELTQRGNRALSVVARLRSGASLSTARFEMQSIAESLARIYPEANAGWAIRVTPLKDEIVGDAGRSLILLFTATCALLLVACANLANLILARQQTRKREMAVRSALGASRLRLARLIVTEHMLLVISGGLLALLLSAAGSRFLARLGPEYLPRSGEVTTDGAVLMFALFAMAVVGIGLAIVIVAEVGGMDLTSMIKGGAGTGLKGGGIMRDSLLVSQVAISLLLLLGGGLLVKSFALATRADLGFTPLNVLSMTVSLPADRYPHFDQRISFFQQLLERVQSTSGITSAAMVSRLPLSGAAANVGPLAEIEVDGEAPASAAATKRGILVVATPDYFRSMGMRLVRGRGFSDSDRGNARPLAIIDEDLARELWPASATVAPRIRVGATLGADTAWREVIGVVSRVKTTSIENEPAPTIYLPHAQTAWPTMSLVVRTVSDPNRFTPVIRRAVLDIDPRQPVYDVRSLEQHVGRALASRRLQTLLFTGFAVISLFLALVGVYGLLAFSVAQQTREIGIRVALGATARHISRMVMRRAAIRIGIGLLVGLMIAPLSARFVRRFLFEVTPWDSQTVASAVLLLVASGLLASYLPARRAAGIDPLTALRRE